MPVNLVKELPREKGCHSPRNNPARPRRQSISEIDIENEFPQLSSSKAQYYIETNDEPLNKDYEGKIWRETIIPPIHMYIHNIQCCPMECFTYSFFVSFQV